VKEARPIAASWESGQFIGLMAAITVGNNAPTPLRSGIVTVEASIASSTGAKASTRVQQNPAAHQQLADVIGFKEDVIGTER
jgi:hypothetical protein